MTAKQNDEWHNGNIPPALRAERALIDVMTVDAKGRFGISYAVPAHCMNPDGAAEFPGWAWRRSAHTMATSHFEVILPN